MSQWWESEFMRNFFFALKFLVSFGLRERITGKYFLGCLDCALLDILCILSIIFLVIFWIMRLKLRVLTLKNEVKSNSESVPRAYPEGYGPPPKTF